MRRRTPRSTLAKLTMPRTPRLLARPRLFDLLDRCRQRQVTWIVGPPGAGKTSLVASYLQTRKLHALWYDIDSGESDPATFFYYLGLAHPGSATFTKNGLPLLTAEFAGDLPGFTLRFFEALYAALPAPSILAFDNYQEVAANSTFHDVMANAIARVPEGVAVFVISRAEPPPHCARHIANGAIARVDFADLQFTLAETGALARTRRKIDADTMRALHAQADGWAAGTVLMLERLERSGELNHIAQRETMGTVFNYFAGQVFADLSAPVRDMLLRTSMFASFTADMPQELSGNVDAGKILDDMHRRHLFTDRRGGDELTYRYHALFRAFLRDRAMAQFAPAAYANQGFRAAQMLDAHGEPEQAFALYVEHKAWPPAQRLILEHASALIKQGRRQTVEEWIAAIPAPLVDREPWLRFWQGACKATLNPRQGRAALENAYAGFVTYGDKLGQLLAAAAIVETYVWDFEFASVREWIDVLETRLDDAPRFASAEITLRVYSAFLMGALYERPDHPLLSVSVDRIEAALLGDSDANQRVSAGTFLLGFCVWGGDTALEQRIIARIHPLMEIPGVTALDRVWWRLRLASHLWLRMDYAGTERVLGEARTIAEDNGLRASQGVNCMLDMMTAAARGDAAAANAVVARIDERLSPTRRSDRVYAHLIRAVRATLHGHAADAVVHVDAAAGVARDLWFPIRYFVLQHRIQVLVAGEHCNDARKSLEDMRALVAGTGFRKCECEILLLEAGIALGENDEDRCRQCLQDCLPYYRREGAFGQAFRWLPALLAEILAIALKHDIEVAYVQSVIRAARLTPTQDASAGQRWPWPVQIFTLGAFAVLKDGQPLAFAGKAQKKPLDLLKAVVALGGRGVDFITVMGILWPDAAGDAQKSLEMALSRLRKLLGVADAIVLHEGKLSLNPTMVWIDTWAFDQALPDDIDHLLGDGGAHSRDVEQASMQRAFALYTGRFLASEPRQAWMQPAGDRLHARFVRLALALGRRLESSNWQLAAQVYERGIELDALSEVLYQRLMISYRERGQVAEAMNVYRRCRDNLSIILGIAPSAETTALYEALRP